MGLLLNLLQKLPLSLSSRPHLLLLNEVFGFGFFLHLVLKHMLGYITKTQCRSSSGSELSQSKLPL